MGSPLKCMICLGAIDQGTWPMRAPLPGDREFTPVARLWRVMEHVWIELEMSPFGQSRDRPCRFDSNVRVSSARSARKFGLPRPSDLADPTNVGHFSVRPDCFKMAEVSLENVAGFLLVGLLIRALCRRSDACHRSR
jgi:hypothetical protein